MQTVLTACLECDRITKCIMYLDFCAASETRLVKLFVPNGLNPPE